MLLLLFCAPLGFALGAFFTQSNRARPWVVTSAALVQGILVAAILQGSHHTSLFGLLALDPLAKLVLGTTTTLFVACAVYLPGYLTQRSEKDNRIFCSCILLFQGVLSLAAMAQHLGLMWVALEACTLSLAPLIYFNQNPRSIEATWKYLLVGSVGIALALLGTYFLGYAVLCGGQEPSLLLSDLNVQAPRMSRPWLHVAYVVLLVGYGTKLGLAPMHSWKPDAYGEAPGIAGALLSGGLTCGAFLSILRVYRVCVAAGEGAFAREPLIALGLFSMLVAALFLVRQKDYKRMLAYSSIEHMGILVLGVGLGRLATLGAMLHLINHALAKGVLFLSAANIHRAFGSKSTDDVKGAWSRVPLSATLFLLGFFAITGSPPYGPFISEFTIVRSAFADSRYFIATVMLLLLIVIFIGMAQTVLAVVQGDLPESPQGQDVIGERWLTVAPQLLLIVALLVLGVYLPPPIARLLHEAVHQLEAI